ncbi:MAG: class I SAM-dependent methyltransferase [Gammaproteobacteria bacterium]|nr:class I SAM-dependent methyltransferase [Gammaproteobacteria bacterium]
MAYHSFYAIERGVPALRKAIWRSFYSLLAKRITIKQWTFMNYGYCSLESEDDRLELSKEDEADRSCIQLYAHTLNSANLNGLDVLEVGSGRGGGCSWIARNQGVKSMMGIDLSGSAVWFCRNRHAVGNLTFLQGDAENLPVPDNSLDAVVNVESCHHYPNLGVFLNEVFRVLKSGGSLYLTDYRDAHEVESFHNHIANSPFEVIHKEDVTANVVAALDRDDGDKRKLIEATVSRLWRGIIEHFAAVKGSDIYKRFVTRRMIYESYELRKS